MQKDTSEKILFILPRDVMSKYDPNKISYNDMVKNEHVTEVCRWTSAIQSMGEFDIVVTTNLIAVLGGINDINVSSMNNDTKKKLMTDLLDVFVKHGIVKRGDRDGEISQKVILSCMKLISGGKSVFESEYVGATHSRHEKIDINAEKNRDKDKPIQTTAQMLEWISKHSHDDKDRDMFEALSSQHNCVPIQFFQSLSKFIDLDNDVKFAEIVDILHSKLDDFIINGRFDSSELQHKHPKFKPYFLAYDLMTGKELYGKEPHVITQEQSKEVLYHFLEQNSSYHCQEMCANIIQTQTFNITMCPHVLVHVMANAMDLQSKLMTKVKHRKSVMVIFDRLFDKSMKIPITHREFMVMQLQLYYYKLNVGVCAYYSQDEVPEYIAVQFDQKYVDKLLAYEWSIMKFRQTMLENQKKSEQTAMIESVRGLSILQEQYKEVKLMFKTNNRIKPLL
jgi:hypothetical protein